MEEPVTPEELCSLVAIQVGLTDSLLAIRTKQLELDRELLRIETELHKINGRLLNIEVRNLPR